MVEMAILEVVALVEALATMARQENLDARIQHGLVVVAQDLKEAMAEALPAEEQEVMAVMLAMKLKMASQEEMVFLKIMVVHQEQQNMVAETVFIHLAMLLMAALALLVQMVLMEQEALVLDS